MKKYAMETVVGIFVVIGLIAVAYMTLKLGHVNILGTDNYSLNARFTNVSGLRSGSPVEIYGIEIGRVESVSIDQQNERALVEMSIKKNVGIYADAIAAIKTEGLIGDKYISIDPGGAEEQLNPGGTIIETQSAIDIVDLVGKYAFGEVEGGKSGEPAAKGQ
jgi:phospholipid/cholesterol/gamma-HCH transport system substrate-binding protein